MSTWRSEDDVRASTYDELGEFHDLFMTEAWEELRPLVAATFGGLGRGAVVVEIGAGSGLGTRVLAEECDAQIVALEPNLLMRSVLTARVADGFELSQRVTVVAGSAPRALSLLPDRVDGVMCTHVLGHLDPLELRSLFAWAADTLSPGGRCLVTVPLTARPRPRPPWPARGGLAGWSTGCSTAKPRSPRPFAVATRFGTGPRWCGPWRSRGRGARSDWQSWRLLPPAPA